MAFPEWPADEKELDARKKSKRHKSSSHGLKRFDNAQDGTEGRLRRRDENFDTDPADRSFGSTSFTSFPDTFADFDLHETPSKRAKIVRRALPLSAQFKPRSFAPKAKEQETPDTQPLPPTPAPAHHVPSIRQGFQLLESAKKSEKHAVRTRVNLDSLSKDGTDGPGEESPVGRFKSATTLVTPSRNGGMSMVKGKPRLASVGSNEDSVGKGITSMPPPHAAVQPKRFAADFASPGAHGSVNTPLKPARTVPAFKTPTSHGQGEGDVVLNQSAGAREANVSRANSGNGLGPLAGGPERAGVHGRTDESLETGQQQAQPVAAVTSTPRRNRIDAHTSSDETRGTEGRGISLLGIAAQISPDRLQGGAGGARDRVMRGGLAARAATVLKRERSDWLLWEHTHCFSVGSVEKTDKSKRGRKGRVLEVVRVLPATRSHHLSRDARQILALCRMTSTDTDAQEEPLVPVLFSSSILHFSSNTSASNHASNHAAGGAKEMDEVMKRLSAMDLQNQRGTESNEAAEDKSNDYRLLVEVWEPTELTLLSSLAKGSEEAIAKSGKDSPALLCTRYKLHRTPQAD